MREDWADDGACSNCKKPMKEHSPEDKKACADASVARLEASLCITCGRINKEHSTVERGRCHDEFIRRMEEGLDRHVAHQAALKVLKPPGDFQT